MRREDITKQATLAPPHPEAMDAAKTTMLMQTIDTITEKNT